MNPWIFVPHFGPNLLVLLAGVPGFLGRRLERKYAYNGEPGAESGESELVEFAYMCAAIIVVCVQPLVLPVYGFWPQLFAFAQFGQQRPVLVAAGSAVAVAGVALTCWARLVLAGNWVGLPNLRERHTLVTAGPYSRIRHPMYTGFALTAIGTAAATLNAVPLVLEGIHSTILLLQTISEERLLQARFGDDYTAYRARTGRIIPRFFARQ